jgi:hypothetical protein
MNKFKVGDSIKVIEGTVDPDYDHINIGGWYGRIFAIEELDGEDGTLYTIEWDSISLKSLDSEIILECIEEGIDYKYISLLESDIEKTVARDKPEDVKEAIAFLDEEFFWTDLGEQGERIRRVISTTKSKSEIDLLKAWESHINENIKLPLSVIYLGEPQKNISEGTKLTLNKITSIDEEFGIMVSVDYKSSPMILPLSDVDVETETNDNSCIQDYLIWYANH